MSKKNIFIIVIAITIAFIFWRSSPEQHSKDIRKWPADKRAAMETMQQHLKQLIDKANKRKFLVSGTVVDQNGKLLEGVKVKIITQLTLGIMPARAYTNTNKLINGNFKIEANGGSTIRLDFSKPGYFMNHKGYILASAIDLKDKNITYDGTTLSAKKQTIVLRKIGKLANLKSRDETFYMDPASKEQDIMDLISFKKIKVKDPKDIKIKKYFYLSVKRDEQGKPEMIFDRQKKLVPKKIFLNYISNDKTDGIIPVTGANIKDMRDLPTAPEKTYALKQIPLKGSWGQDFFYYKNGNTYGKVWIQQSRFVRGKARAVMLVKQNNDKDPKERRNLRSYAF